MTTHDEKRLSREIKPGHRIRYAYDAEGREAIEEVAGVYRNFVKTRTRCVKYRDIKGYGF